MPQGSEFTDVERGTIIGLREAGWTFAAIADKLGRSKSGVSQFWRTKDYYKSAKRPGRPRKVNARTQRRVILEAKTAKKSFSALKSSLGLSVSSCTVRRVLQQAPDMTYGKRNRTPMLKLSHKLARRQWARAMIKARTDWDQIIFSDEKKFNLDGSDGLQYYWYDLRCEKEAYSSRQNGGGSVMVWGGFSSNGKTELAFLVGRQDSLDYQETLTNYLLPFGEAFHGGDYTFQQDNASIHAPRSTRAYLSSCSVDVLEWPALSPDLNPIENVWGILARQVYRGGKTYLMVNELKIAIAKSWEDLELERLQNLVESMPDRVADVMEEKGNTTKH